VTLSTGTHNVRKLFAREAMNITGGSLTVNYNPNYPSDTVNYPNALRSGPISAQFSAPVSLSGSGALSVHTLQVDATRTFTLAGGSLTLNTINLMPHSTTPATMLVNGDANLSPLANAAAIIVNGSGSGSSGRIDLGGGVRNFNVANGSAATDLSVNVPIINGGLTKSGLGTLALNGANTYTGNTAVQAGTLSVANAFFANAADVYVSTGATLDLKYSGTPDTINSLFFDGAQQAAGIWGAVGSGAEHTSPLITGTGLLQVSTFVPPMPGPGNVLDDFEVDEGHFNWNYNFSPQTTGLASGPGDSTMPSDRVTTEHQGVGVASQLLDMVSDGSPAWQLRHNSGIGTVAAPAGNVPLEGTGNVGFWLKTDDPGITVRIGIDDPVGGNTALELGIPLNVTADNQWHLYQWNFDDDAQWDAFAGGANGLIDAVLGTVTIDSIWLAGSGNAQIYLDTVSHNPDGPLAAAPVPGDFNGDGTVDSADYNVWRAAYGTSTAPGTSADGNGDSTIDTADYVVWRTHMGAGFGSAVQAAAAPEPTSIVLLGLAASVVFTLCAKRASR
jgi:autotransporter-associated beta strand protein